MTAQISPNAFVASPLSPSLPQHDAKDLTKGGHLALITLNDQIYALRITRQGKLILTK
ncbi:hemin uptake protein HemP [Tabrizicola sp.]|jgi:hemin uptake protein HemP|uniref:hemin uptake protein HemP n=1 Tax=Tabrizicola sp. TaxID=2005166 RepID=UPI003D27F0F3